MSVFGAIGDLFGDYTLRTVALGSAVLGLVSGALGSFAVLRRQSLLGDAISHAALPGVAAAFLVMGSKAPLVLMLGAGVAGWVGTLIVMSVVRSARVAEDAALGIVLSVFFGAGLVLLTFIQRLPGASKAGLDKFLFGQAATMLPRDVVAMLALGLPAVAIVVVMWKEFKLLAFDPDFGRSSGFPIPALDVALTSLLVIAIVIGLQTVGAVLMSAMIVAPAAAARQWTDRLGVMVLLSGAFGAASGGVGAVVSSTTRHLPTGPTIVLCASAVVFVSLLLSPNRGIVWGRLRERRNNRRIETRAVLEDLYTLAAQHGGAGHAHPVAVLRAMSAGHGGADRTLRELEARGWARRIDGGYAITDEGVAQVDRWRGADGK